MTPERLRGSKNYRFDRQVEGVGRIRRSAGTDDPKEFHRRDAVLTKLIEAGALETLRLFKAGQLSTRDLVDADRNGRLLQAADRLRLHRSLRDEVNRWLPYSAAAKQSRRRYEVSWDRLFRVAKKHRLLSSAASVGELSRVEFARLSRLWDAGPADWNRTRAAVSAFLTAYLGHLHHPFRLQVMRLFRALREPPARQPRLRPKQFWTLIQRAEPRVRASYVAMAVLGCGPDEYLRIRREDLDREQLEVHVPGTKTRQRDRYVSVSPDLWAWIDRAVPSPLAYRWLNTWFKRAAEQADFPGLRMYDLRHLSAQYAGDFGATDRDLTIHMGHSRVDQSHQYSARRTARKVAAAVGQALVADMPEGLSA